MKKAMFLGIAALLALAVFSCDGFNIPKDETKAGIDAWDLSGEPPLQPGEFFIGYNIGTSSGGRALTAPLAKAGSDFFEAVLVYEVSSPDVAAAIVAPIVHRSVFREGKYGRMEAPHLGEYNNNPVTSGTLGTDQVTTSYKAYLFAGRNDDRTLLGIGTITHIDNNDGSGFVTGALISQATRGVAFTIEPLTTDVTTEPATPGATSSDRGTFRPWSASDDGTGNAGAYTDVAKRIQIDNMPASIFLLPAQTAITADYDVETTKAAGIKFLPFTNTKLPISGPTALKNEVIPNGFIWSDGDYAPITVPTDIGTITSDATKITFPLTIKTNDPTLTIAGTPPVLIRSGLGRLSLNVPVVNLTDADAANQQIPDLKLPVVWYIRGGINNVLIDQGKDFNEQRGSLGGAVLIGVGNVLSGAGGFIIKAGYGPGYVP